MQEGDVDPDAARAVLRLGALDKDCAEAWIIILSLGAVGRSVMLLSPRQTMHKGRLQLHKPSRGDCKEDLGRS